ncbi:MAG: hypothetical protein HYZ87_03985 [Candidatus Omnitrophica bacterium]|nr:hypothetical protein [Candidatus Omnitrophota bacterium]
MGIIESIKKGFSVARHSLDLLVVLSLFSFVWNLINLYIAPNLETPAPPVQFSAGIVIASILFILASIFMQAGSLGYIRDHVKSGSAALSGFTASGAKYYAPLFILGLIIAAIVVAFVLVAALVTAFLNNVIGVILAVVIAGVGIYAALLLFLAPYGVVARDHKAMVALKESIQLVRANILKILGIGAILILIGFAIGLVTGIVFGLLSAAQGLVFKAIFALVSSVLNGFLGIVVTGSFMSFYLAVSNNNTSGAD